MKVVIASGKGGTGKTSITAALAVRWDRPRAVVDLDVETPNLHLFLTPQFTGRRQAHMTVPRIDEALCTHCGLCGDLCQFRGITVLGETVLICPEMCHGCGGCLAVCPTHALCPDERLLGTVDWGHCGNIPMVMGRLRVGEAMSPPLMRQVCREADARTPEDADLLVDAPPGVSCPAVTAARYGDAIVLVTEPTPFGLYDLTLAHRAFAPLGKPMGVVINRCDVGTGAVGRFCLDAGLPVLAEIPFRRQAAEAYANGGLITDADPAIGRAVDDLQQAIHHLSMAPSESAHG